LIEHDEEAFIAPEEDEDEDKKDKKDKKLK
jgi:hypothetical protein